MKSYIEMAEKLRASRGSESSEHRKAADEARRMIDTLKGKRALAIAEGRQSDYKTICQDIEYYEGRERFELDQAAEDEIPEGDFLPAWLAYREDYEREFDKRFRAYNKIRRQAAEAYAELLTFMNEGNRQKDSYISDARISAKYDHEELRLPVTADAFKPSRRITADAGLLASLDDDPIRVVENAALIEGGEYVKGGLYGETVSEALSKRYEAPKTKELYYWEQGGRSELLTREQFRERQLAHLTPAERKAWYREHGISV